jgi:putative tryptophan/tyrosine transport system substrate-binding protein
MQRRTFLAGVFGIVSVRTARARPPTVVYLGLGSERSDQANLSGLRQGLAELGHQAGSTTIVKGYFAEGEMYRHEAAIDEVVADGVAVIVVPGISAALTVHQRAPQIPLVVVGLPSTAIFPELFGSLDRPGGNVTGFSHFGEDIAEERVELLREISPGIRKIGIIHNAKDPLWGDWGRTTESAARRQGLSAIRLGVVAPSVAELRNLLQMAGEAGVDGLVVVRDFLTAILEEDIARTALALGMASIGEKRRFVEFGGLLSYGADIPELFRRAASYVHRIVGGESPAVMPIQLATEFDLVVNAATAKSLSIVVPSSILLRSDEVIE